MPKASTLATSSPATVTALREVLGVQDVLATVNIYDDTTAGLAATSDGDYFSVPSADSDEYLILYLNNAGVADEVKTYPSAGVVQGMLGGASVSDQQLKDWTSAGSFEATSITRNTAGVVTSATVKWPDGSGGSFTATTVSTTFNAVDAYTITHTTASRKVTQAAVTRNSAGAVTAKPALTVGDA